MKLRDWAYRGCLLAILLVGIALRCTIPNIHRQIVQGDETTYHYAALDIIKFGTLTREVSGDMFRGIHPATPTPSLSPGYPLFLAAIYGLGGDESTAFIVQIGLSIATLALILLLLRMLGVGRGPVLIAMLAASLYPGFIYNIDRLLTENLFLPLFSAYCVLFVSFLQCKRTAALASAGILLALAIHVRPTAAPFGLVSLAVLALYGSGIKDACRNVAIFSLPILLLMLPWWIRNAVDFHRLVLLTDGGEGARIWGSVPYFIDMASTNGRSLQQVVAANWAPDPAVYDRWRVFGFLQFMWGDLWDEWVVHPNPLLRPFLWLHWFVVVPSVMAIPLLLRRASTALLFICAIPVIFTVMNMPFHGLPRYVYPSIPFVFVIFGVLIDRVFSIREATFALATENAAQHGVRFLAMLFSGLISLGVGYSVYMFSFSEHTEMSEYRLARYMGVTRARGNMRLVASQAFLPGTFSVENTTTTRCGSEICYQNTGDGPSVIRLAVRGVDAERAIVTAVSIRSNGGYLYDYATVYWQGQKIHTFSENFVYRFPVSAWTRNSTVYIDDDVSSLMIVPYVFLYDHFKISRIEVKKYEVESRRRPPTVE